jgi:hypothetical protein
MGGGCPTTRRCPSTAEPAPAAVSNAPARTLQRPGTAATPAADRAVETATTGRGAHLASHELGQQAFVEVEGEVLVDDPLAVLRLAAHVAPSAAGRMAAGQVVQPHGAALCEAGKQEHLMSEPRASCTRASCTRCRPCLVGLGGRSVVVHADVCAHGSWRSVAHREQSKVTIRQRCVRVRERHLHRARTG